MLSEVSSMESPLGWILRTFLVLPWPGMVTESGGSPLSYEAWVGQDFMAISVPSGLLKFSIIGPE